MAKFYVAGGIYEKDGEFKMVSPSGKNDLPYIFTDIGGYTHTEHHAHLYEVIDDLELKLAKHSWRADKVEAPEHVVLTEERRTALLAAIIRGEYIGR